MATRKTRVTAGETSKSPLVSKQQIDLTYKLEEAVMECLSENAVISKFADSITEKVKKDLIETLKLIISDQLTAVKEDSNSRIELFEQETLEKLDKQEQYLLRNAVRVFGIEETKNENTDKLVIDLFHDKLAVQVPTDAISQSYRVGRRRNDKKPRPIIVKFISYKHRCSVYQKKKLLKGTKLSIKEDLTARRARLLQLTTDKVGLGNAWTIDGRVMISLNGKKKHIHSVGDLDNIPTSRQPSEKARDRTTLEHPGDKDQETETESDDDTLTDPLEAKDT